MHRQLTISEYVAVLNAQRKACELLERSHHAYAHSQALAGYRATKDAIQREGLTWVYTNGEHIVYKEGAKS